MAFSTIPLLRSSPLLPNSIVFLNYTIVIITPIFIVAAGKVNAKYGEDVLNLVKIRKKDKSILLRGVTLLEWTLFALCYVWIFLICFFLSI